jgi:cytidine deaminase
MSTFTNTKLLDDVRDRLPFSVLKSSRNDRGFNTSSVALSKSGHSYFGGKVESDSNLLDITSEQSALLLAAQHGDFNITEVVTFADGNARSVSPLPIKIMIDWSVRTEIPLKYTCVNREEDVIFVTEDVSKAIPWYSPEKNALTLPQERLGENFESIEDISVSSLRDYTRKGITRGFHTYDGATTYGVALFTKKKTVYYTAQYSSPDKRLGVHAEAAALVSAFMRGDRDITHLGIMSPKFKDTTCAPCGSCRQFIGEFSKKFNWNLEILSFAHDTDTTQHFSVDDLIPHMWAS